MFGAFVGATVGLGVAGAEVGVGMGVEGAFVAGAGVAEWAGSGATVEVILAVSSTCRNGRGTGGHTKEQHSQQSRKQEPISFFQHNGISFAKMYQDIAIIQLY